MDNTIRSTIVILLSALVLVGCEKELIPHDYPRATYVSAEENLRKDIEMVKKRNQDKYLSGGGKTKPRNKHKFVEPDFQMSWRYLPARIANISPSGAENHLKRGSYHVEEVVIVEGGKVVKSANSIVLDRKSGALELFEGWSKRISNRLDKDWKCAEKRNAPFQFKENYCESRGWLGAEQAMFLSIKSRSDLFLERTDSTQFVVQRMVMPGAHFRMWE